MKRVHLLLLLAAIFVGLLARIPGIFWGYNFPGGWAGHHVDEYTHVQIAKPLINPYAPVEWQHPYPKGMAVHAALPILFANLLKVKMRIRDPKDLPNPPAPIVIIATGRVASVVYGAATVLVVFLLAQSLFPDVRVALLSAWIFALGGLHVSQSHFFLADVPALFWFLLGTYFLLREAQLTDQKQSYFLLWAAFCFGVAFGLKLTLSGLPSLAICAVLIRPRIMRAVHGAVFFLSGFALVNSLSYTPFELFKTFLKGTSDPYKRSVFDNLSLYLIQLPGIVSAPVLLLAVTGGVILLRKLLRSTEKKRRWQIFLIVLLPMPIHLFVVLFRLDHFARHIIPFIPWMAMAAAWSLIQTGEFVRARGVRPAFVLMPLFLYLAIFVYDGEKVFIQDPRNEAARWVQANVPQGTNIYWRTHTNFPGYVPVQFPEAGRPPVLVLEMHRVNDLLSGMKWKNSYPANYRYVFDSDSQARLEAFQALFKGTSEYQEVARFREGYFMPEYTLAERLIGNRARNYVAEIVIFTKPANGVAPQEPPLRK